MFVESYYVATVDFPAALSSTTEQMYPNEIPLGNFSPINNGETTMNGGIYLTADTGRDFVIKDEILFTPDTKLDIWAVQCIYFMDSVETETHYYYLQYAIISGYSFYAVPDNVIQSFADSGYPIQDPFQKNPSDDGLIYNENSIVSWLYNIGYKLFVDNPVAELLSFEIGGYSLVSILVGAGFSVYVTWVVTKWIIP